MQSSAPRLPRSRLAGEEAYELLPVERLRLEAAALRRKYLAGQPYPHVVIDDLFDPEVLDRLLLEFPGSGFQWHELYDANEQKMTTAGDRDLPAFTRAFLQALNSPTFIAFVRQITGITTLLADPVPSLHQVVRGGVLKIHADYNRIDALNLDRRVNLLIYLNKDWRDEYDGHLELWDEQGKGCQTRVAPLFNRTVIFESTDRTLHGHPQPLACPENVTRKSIAMAYFSAGRPAEQTAPTHGVLYLGRKGVLQFSSRDRLRSWVPPALLEIYRDLARRRKRG